MKELIEQIYDNDCSLAHSPVSQAKEITGAFLVEERLVKKLEPLLNEEALKIFNEFQDLHLKLVCDSQRQGFVAGFRTGMRMAVEVYGDD